MIYESEKMDISAFQFWFIKLFLCIFTLFSEVLEIDAGEKCTVLRPNQKVEYIYCQQSCCGSATQRYCCALTTTGLYVGAVAGGAVCVALIVGIVICCVYKGKKTRIRRHRQRQNRDYDDDDLFTTTVYRAGTPKPPPYSHLPPPAYSEVVQGHSDVQSTHAHNTSVTNAHVPDNSVQKNVPKAHVDRNVNGRNATPHQQSLEVTEFSDNDYMTGVV